jgi:hypothetical protein
MYVSIQPGQGWPACAQCKLQMTMTMTMTIMMMMMMMMMMLTMVICVWIGSCPKGANPAAAALRNIMALLWGGYILGLCLTRCTYTPFALFSAFVFRRGVGGIVFVLGAWWYCMVHMYVCAWVGGFEWAGKGGMLWGRKEEAGRHPVMFLSLVGFRML